MPGNTRINPPEVATPLESDTRFQKWRDNVKSLARPPLPTKLIR